MTRFPAARSMRNRPNVASFSGAARGHPLRENALIVLQIIAAIFSTAQVPTALAQDKACIVAGRLNDAGQWAPGPRARGLSLLDAQGKAVTSASPDALAGVTQVKLAQPALLAACEGTGKALAEGPESSGGKGGVPQLAAGRQPVPVTAVHFPKLKTGQLVELQVDAPAGRVTTRR